MYTSKRGIGTLGTFSSNSYRSASLGRSYLSGSSHYPNTTNITTKDTSIPAIEEEKLSSRDEIFNYVIIDLLVSSNDPELENWNIPNDVMSRLSTYTDLYSNEWSNWKNDVNLHLHNLITGENRIALSKLLSNSKSFSLPLVQIDALLRSWFQASPKTYGNFIKLASPDDYSLDIQHKSLVSPNATIPSEPIYMLDPRKLRKYKDISHDSSSQLSNYSTDYIPLQSHASRRSRSHSRIRGRSPSVRIASVPLDAIREEDSEVENSNDNLSQTETHLKNEPELVPFSIEWSLNNMIDKRKVTVFGYTPAQKNYIIEHIISGKPIELIEEKQNWTIITFKFTSDAALALCRAEQYNMAGTIFGVMPYSLEHDDPDVPTSHEPDSKPSKLSVVSLNGVKKNVFMPRPKKQKTWYDFIINKLL